MISIYLQIKIVYKCKRQKKAKDIHAKEYFSTSSVTGYHVNYLFDLIAADLLEKNESTFETIYENQGIDITKDEKDVDKKCC